MTFPVLGGNGAVGVTGYQIDNSLRFNRSDSAYLTRTHSSEGNRKTWTFSAWFKQSVLISRCFVFSGGQNDQYQNNFGIEFGAGTIKMYDYNIHHISTTGLFRDPSAFFHMVVAVDTTQSTASNRIKLYINGEQITDFSIATYPSQNENTGINSAHTHSIGSSYGGLTYGGYMADVYLIDGQQLSPTDFGEVDSDSGIWKPKQYEGTYGTNGFKLNFSNSGSLGADSSGNGNNFTPTNLASTDQTTDTPTNNFATFNERFKRTSVNPTFSEGNLKVVQGASNGIAYSTQGVYSGKWYAEIKVDDVGTATSCGILEPSAYDNGNPDSQAIYYQSNGNKNNKGSASGYGDSYTTGDIIGIALDADNGTLTFYKNGVSQGIAFTGLDTNTTWLIGCHGYINIGSSGQSGNYGNPPFAISSGNSDDNGYGNFEYAPPSGYLALCTQNLATELSPTIDDASQYFNTILYTGTGTTQSITGVGFQPDLVWLKARTQPYYLNLYDIIRGGTKAIFSNASVPEATDTGNLQTFDSDGFTADGFAGTNGSGVNYVAWNWLASNTTASNTDGTITSTVSVNQTSGFSVVTYTGNGTDNSTIGHGLGKAPSMIIIKCRNSDEDWMVYHKNLTAGSEIRLNSSSGQSDDTNNATWGDNHPSSVGSSTFAVGYAGDSNSNGNTYVAYCFAEIEGYSKFGKWTGTGTQPSPFVYTGFKPSWIMYKRLDTSSIWVMIDAKRSPINTTDKYLRADTTATESTYDILNFMSNGFEIDIISPDASTNTSGADVIYMAFAENPFVTSSGVPNTAK